MGDGGRMSSRDEAAHILDEFRAQGTANIYLVTPPEGEPVALYTQQCRALNLVWALDRVRPLNERSSGGSRVVVIGGGVAGLTAAAAAAVCGAQLQVLEREYDLLRTQHGCHHRFLHPRIHEWPSDKSLMASANLPLLNWSLGSAHAVAEQLLEGFHDVRNATGRVGLFTIPSASHSRKRAASFG